jgi:hypothetical protein
MATDAILETIKPRRSEEQLPVTTAAAAGTRLRRRVSSFSAHVRPPPGLSSSAAAAFRRARSMPTAKALAAAGALRRWWEWVTAPFAPRGDDDDEARPLGGCRCACAGGPGGWRHVLVSSGPAVAIKQLNFVFRWCIWQYGMAFTYVLEYGGRVYGGIARSRKERRSIERCRELEAWTMNGPVRERTCN